MKKYYAAKPRNFGGKTYFIGNEIPASLIDPNREKKLIQYGIINVVELPDPEPEQPATAPDKDNQQAPTGDGASIGDESGDKPDTKEAAKDKPEKPSRKNKEGAE